jgi:predicted phage terminase large subunit-like protein
LLSRLDDKANDAIVVVMQRLHVDDLSGRLLEEGGWEHLCLPAIAELDETFAVARGRTIDRTRGSVLDEVREPRPVLEELRRELGSATFEAQYQQSPVPSERALVRWSWFGMHSGEPDLGPGDRWVISWDTATKGGEVNDYSVGVVALVRAAGAVEIVQVIRERLEFPNLRRRMLLEARRRPGSVTLIEDAGTGAALHQDLRHEAGMYAIAIRREGDKIVRLTAVTPVIEAGKVSLPHDAPWLDVFKRELLSFPHSKNDDQVDALAQLLNWADKRRYSFAYSRQI